MARRDIRRVHLDIVYRGTYAAISASSMTIKRMRHSRPDCRNSESFAATQVGRSSLRRYIQSQCRLTRADSTPRIVLASHRSRTCQNRQVPPHGLRCTHDNSSGLKPALRGAVMAAVSGGENGAGFAARHLAV